LLDLSREVLVIVNGAETFRGLPRPSLAVLLATGGGVDPARTYTARVAVTE